MMACPSSKIFIHKFTINSKKSKRKYRECKHIVFSNFAYHSHEILLECNKLLFIINHISSIRKFFISKKSFKIFSIENRNICERRLINSQKFLVYHIDKLLEGLISIVFRTLNTISFFTVFLPKIKHIN